MIESAVIAAIRQCHLKANISTLRATFPHGDILLRWDLATLDPGGTLWGRGPYVKLPVENGGDRIVIRVYAPARLRRRLEKGLGPRYFGVTT